MNLDQSSEEVPLSNRENSTLINHSILNERVCLITTIFIGKVYKSLVIFKKKKSIYFFAVLNTQWTKLGVSKLSINRNDKIHIKLYELLFIWHFPLNISERNWACIVVVMGTDAVSGYDWCRAFLEMKLKTWQMFQHTDLQLHFHSI